MSRKLPVLSLALAALSLGACAPEAQSGDGATDSDYAWHFQQNEFEGAKLAYGAPSSDDVLLMLTCAPGSGQVAMSVIAEESRPQIVLASNGAHDSFAANASDSELGGVLVEAKARASAASLARFARTGELSMKTNGDQVSLAAGAGDREQVSRFFSVCQP